MGKVHRVPHPEVYLLLVNLFAFIDIDVKKQNFHTSCHIMAMHSAIRNLVYRDLVEMKMDRNSLIANIIIVTKPALVKLFEYFIIHVYSYNLFL